MVTYPGNPKPSIQRYAEIPKNRVNESTISIGSHTGTHVDSNLHIRDQGNSVIELPLHSFYGKCKVLDLTDVLDAIHKEDLDRFQIMLGDIILLKTRNSTIGYEQFNENFVHVKIDAAQYLVESGVKTLGFDYLSVKKFGGDPEVHELLINNLTLFEGLNLADVPEGEYLFIGLPLSIECDGAPARAVLVEK
jgi:arylformamidase